VGKLKAIHIVCKRDTESAKVAPENVLNNRGNLEGTHLTRFSRGGGLSPGGYLRTPIVPSLEDGGGAFPLLHMPD